MRLVPGDPLPSDVERRILWAVGNAQAKLPLIRVGVAPADARRLYTWTVEADGEVIGTADEYYDAPH